MAWRSLHISQQSRLSLKDQQMVIEQADGTVRLPLEDVGWIILDSPQISLTSPVLSACMELGVVVVTTAPNHLPNGLVLPFHSHHRQAEMAHLQIAMADLLKKRLWRLIIQQKIINQAAVLKKLHRPRGDDVAEYVPLVRSGDPDNVEARAARTYWSALMPNFRRDDDTDRRNGLLNYGYAIVRAVIARNLVGCGLLPAFGLHHASVSNAFNLADDLIEPFRPLVDWLTHSLPQDRDGDVTLTDRRAMTGILLSELHMAGQTMILPVAAEECVNSLVRCIVQKTPALLQLPEIPP